MELIIAEGRQHKEYDKIRGYIIGNRSWQALPWSCVYSHGVTKTFKLNYDKQVDTKSGSSSRKGSKLPNKIQKSKVTEINERS